MNDITMAIVILVIVQLFVVLWRRLRWWRKPWTKFDCQRF